MAPNPFPSPGSQSVGDVQLGTCERYQLAAFSHSREEEHLDELSRETFNIVAMNDSVFSPKIETLHMVA